MEGVLFSGLEVHRSVDVDGRGEGHSSSRGEG